MTAPVDIVNRALSAIGARSGAAGTSSAITSLSENSNEAFQANMLYLPTVRDLLRAAHWDFARTVATLSLLKSAPGTPENPTQGGQWTSAYPAPPWLYQYAYPAACLMMRAISPFNNSNTGFGSIGTYLTGVPQMQAFLSASDVDVDGNPLRVVLTNVRDALGIFTMDWSGNPDQWDSNFQECVVVALAGRLAMPLTGNLQIGNVLKQEAAAYVLGARVTNGNEGQTIIDNVPDWIRIRGFQEDFFEGGNFIQPWLTPGWLGI